MVLESAAMTVESAAIPIARPLVAIAGRAVAFAAPAMTMVLPALPFVLRAISIVRPLHPSGAQVRSFEGPALPGAEHHVSLRGHCVAASSPRGPRETPRVAHRAHRQAETIPGSTRSSILPSRWGIAPLVGPIPRVPVSGSGLDGRLAARDAPETLTRWAASGNAELERRLVGHAGASAEAKLRLVVQCPPTIVIPKMSPWRKRQFIAGPIPSCRDYSG